MNVKKWYVYIIGIALMLTGCTLERTVDSELDGFWQLEQIEDLDSGEKTDMHESGLYWTVQMRLLEVWNTNKNMFHESVFFRFSREGNVLTLSEPYYDYRNKGDIKIEDASELNRYYIYNLEERFTVEVLTGSTLQLKNERIRFFFRRY